MEKKIEKCVQCGWPEDAHTSQGFCYSYSDQDTDYFHNDRKFVSPKSLEGKVWSRAFNGKIIIDERQT